MSIAMPYAYMYDQNNQKLGLTNYAHQFFVDGANGDDANNGRDWAHAFATIQVAITASNALVDWGDLRINVIWVKPGIYVENIHGDILFTHIIGLGVGGDDGSAKIYPTTGSVVSVGAEPHCYVHTSHLANLWFQVNDDVPIFDVEVMMNSLFEDCVFHYFNVADGGTGIDTDDCKGTEIRRCSFTCSGTGKLNYGMYFRGGADKYVHDCRIHDNNIFAALAGIWIQGAPPCVATMTVIWNNRIIGTPAAFIGIDDNQGASYVIDNFITALAGDAIDHAGGVGHTVGNRIIDSGVAGGGWEI